MTSEQIIDEVIRLPLNERRHIAQAIWQSYVNESVGDDSSEEDIAEYDRRCKELDDFPERGIPWETVKAEIESRRK